MSNQRIILEPNSTSTVSPELLAKGAAVVVGPTREDIERESAWLFDRGLTVIAAEGIGQLVLPDASMAFAALVFLYRVPEARYRSDAAAIAWSKERFDRLSFAEGAEPRPKIQHFIGKSSDQLSTASLMWGAVTSGQVQRAARILQQAIDG